MPFLTRRRPAQSPGDLTWSRTFPATPDQSREARRFLSEILAADLPAGTQTLAQPQADDAISCLAEMTANSIQHSDSAAPGGTFTVRVILTSDRLRVEVTDQGGAWSANPDSGGQRGRGLSIVSALSASWGVATDNDPGRIVWFEIQVRAACLAR